MRFNLSKKLLMPTACLVIIGMAISILVAYFSSKNALEGNDYISDVLKSKTTGLPMIVVKTVHLRLEGYHAK